MQAPGVHKSGLHINRLSEAAHFIMKHGDIELCRRCGKAGICAQHAESLDRLAVICLYVLDLPCDILHKRLIGRTENAQISVKI